MDFGQNGPDGSPSKLSQPGSVFHLRACVFPGIFEA